MRRRVKPYTAGQCVDDVNRALKRYYAQYESGSRELYAVLDCVMRLRCLKPRYLRVPAEGAE